MNKVFILNASPIILLGKAGLLKTVSPLADLWIVPEKVVSEVEAKIPISANLSDLSHYEIEFAQQLDPLVMSWDLGPGESEVLTIALKKGNAAVVLDDLLARKCATLLKLPLIGSIGLLVKARRIGLIDSVRPEIEKLIEAGLRIDPETLKKVYTIIGE
jgi:predicted nucleic acid-binding protein